MMAITSGVCAEDGGLFVFPRVQKDFNKKARHVLQLFAIVGNQLFFHNGIK